MNIDTYERIMGWFYLGLMLLALLAVLVVIVLRILRRPFRYDWLAPYVVLYSTCAGMGMLSALLAYDDVASPNYHMYKDWQMHHFVLNDIRMLMVWAAVGVVLDSLFRRRRCTMLKAVIWALLAVMAGVLAWLLITAL